VRSLRACWRLFRAEVMSSRRERHTGTGAHSRRSGRTCVMRRGALGQNGRHVAPAIDMHARTL
jgi:hypothetical protein